jgi:predicted ATPase/DNA-binding CsgD family transcriptional regulator
MVRSVSGRLPAPVTSLVGRETEVAAARSRLVDDGVRLLTLTGPGGVGKTRLAIQIGEAVRADFPDGVIFVPLAPIVAPELLLPTLARAVGLRDSGERPLFDVVGDILQQRRLLLILDNMEHLAEAAPLFSTLLATCPSVTALFTSRVLLHLSGEHTFPVSPLALPEAPRSLRATRHAVAGIARADAIQLFVERARAVQPAFALTADNAVTIGAVCRQVDGLPLAIELAAARLRVLSPEALLSDLEQRLRLLTDGPRDVSHRLRTMRHAIAWSVDLLSPEQRSLFCRLAVFVGGFSLEATEWMSGVGDRAPVFQAPFTRHPSTAPLDALELLTSLVDQSLVQRAEQPEEPPRFRMLETIQSYALHELASSGEEAAVRNSHGAWCLAFAERAEPELSGSQQKTWFDRLEAEHPNLRAALHWFLAQNDAERGLRLASALTWFWSSRSYFREARQWLMAFLALPTSAPTRGRGLLEAANILHWLGEESLAVCYAEESLAIFQREGDAFLAMCAMRRLGSIAIDQRDFARAARLLAESRTLVQTAAPPWDARWDAAFADFLSGRLAVAAGRHDEAIACLADAITAFQEIGDRGYVAAALGLQGAEWVKLGEVASARTAYATSLELAGELGDHTWVAWALIGAAHLAHHDGHIASAMRLLGAATAMREAIGERRLPESALTPALQETVKSGRFAREWKQGARLSGEEAMVIARAILGIADGRHDSDVASPVLTAREREVLFLLADGVGDKSIAATLGISRRTASQHVATILAKLGAESRTAAVSIALRRGLLPPSDSDRT